MEKQEMSRRIFRACLVCIVCILSGTLFLGYLPATDGSGTPLASSDPTVETYRLQHRDAIEQLFENCRVRYLYMMPKGDVDYSTVLSPSLLDQSDDEVQNYVNDLVSGATSLPENVTAVLYDVEYKQDAVRLTAFGLFPSGGLYGRRITTEGLDGTRWRFTQIEADGEPLIELTPDTSTELLKANHLKLLLSEMFCLLRSGKFAHFKFSDIMAAATSEMLSEDIDSVGLKDIPSSFDRDGNLISPSNGPTKSIVLHKNSGLPLRIEERDTEGKMTYCRAFEVAEEDGRFVPKRILTENYDGNGQVIARNIYLIYDYDFSPIDPGRFVVGSVMETGARIFDEELDEEFIAE